MLSTADENEARWKVRALAKVGLMGPSQTSVRAAGMLFCERLFLPRRVFSKVLASRCKPVSISLGWGGPGGTRLYD